MAAPAAPARPAPAKEIVRHAEVIGMWAVDCVYAHRRGTDWAQELLGDRDHRLARATLEDDGYHLDCFHVRRVAGQRGTAYMRLFCAISVRSGGLSPDLQARTLRGIVDELLLARARTGRAAGRLIDAAVVAVP
jgi:hypothetical protein